METRQWDGKWWLPDTPEQEVAGTLTLQPDGRMVLALIGALDSHLRAAEVSKQGGTTTYSFTERSMETAGIYPRVLGRAGSKLFTLEDCFQTRRSGLGFSDHESQQLSVGQAFTEVHFEPDEPLEFHKASAWMEGLAYWVMESGLERSLEFVDGEADTRHLSGMTVRVTRLPTQTCSDGGHATVSLTHTFNVSSGDVLDCHVAEDFCFSVSVPTKEPLPNLLERLSDLQDLVSIGTGRAAAYSRVSFGHPGCLV